MCRLCSLGKLAQSKGWKVSLSRTDMFEWPCIPGTVIVPEQVSLYFQVSVFLVVVLPV